ncbi:MAG: hypothetical protein CBD74_10370 [Saprospirales bacterium TMED214]|nr:MAG: hypothetical protein CBD74_10370 [Saprospirales bacterium TMED214]
MDNLTLFLLLGILPALLIGGISLAMVHTLTKKQIRREEIQLKRELGELARKDLIPIRLQAYERMALFMHRMSPAELIRRTQSPKMTASTLKQALITTMRAEFEHNITQQIYLSRTAWETIYAYQESLRQVIEQCSTDLDPKVPGFELGKRILEFYIENDQNVITTEQVITRLQVEVKHMFDV